MEGFMIICIIGELKKNVKETMQQEHFKVKLRYNKGDYKKVMPLFVY